jgi:ubiquinone/menaquinone biosynthesis C-methylase UbiE
MHWLMAAVYDRIMAKTEAHCLAAWRAELLSDVRGEVLDVGAGTGANLPYYTKDVERLVLAEPDPHMRVRLERKLAAQELPAEVTDGNLEALPFADDCFDVVVSTLVLCSVADPAASVREILRVLRPGGRFVFLEHVASDDPGRYRWQRRLEPLWRLLAGDCHVTRHTAQTIESAGLRLESCTRESMRKALPIVRPTVRGVAVAPTPRSPGV